MPCGSWSRISSKFKQMQPWMDDVQYPDPTNGFTSSVAFEQGIFEGKDLAKRHVVLLVTALL